ncbi:HigA family addiction module antitoxin [Rhodobacter capsulatus]|uniref:Plasmid maintenance system antidote protein, XRE family n=1 Tax=Rhodobacter capsulatus TaxID=1061 RepID=A0A1G7QST0_RHOCA|nr:HigA family addiction module antitoxin [Rhodobacter capsulatus]WER11001.1 HigA family addiction module antitoxin [Rhodobacter capsulatus]SDG01543.1 plasmid maintenance system antidote protein, XRE family [Rhodobacter capsulatus]
MITLANPSHPGAVLDELFLSALDLSAGALAKKLGVPRTRIERLVKGETALTADTALRLSGFFGNTAEFWMNLQRAYDLDRARKTVDVSFIQPMQAT